MIYNEACCPVFGNNHPRGLGARGEDIWGDLWAYFASFLTKAETEGKATRVPNWELPMNRHGYLEETVWNANFIPIIGAKGKCLGVLDEFTECTHNFIQERRRDMIVKTWEALSSVNTLEKLWDGFLDSIQKTKNDIPFAAIYVPTDSSHNNPAGVNTPLGPAHHFSLRASFGLGHFMIQNASSFDFHQAGTPGCEFFKVFENVWKSAKMTILHADDGSLPEMLAHAGSNDEATESVKTVCIIPVSDLMSNSQLAFVVLALTPRRPFDASASWLIGSLSDVLTRASSTIFLPDEQRRGRRRIEEIEMALAQQKEAALLETGRIEARFEKMLKEAPVGV